MKGTSNGVMIADTKTCGVCGGPLTGALAALGAVCPICVVRSTQLPTDFSDPSGTTTPTWAEVFPQLEIERALCGDENAPVYLARVVGEEETTHTERAVLQIVTGAALTKAGGVSLLETRARKLSSVLPEGLLPILDFGDLSDAFFLVTEAPALPLLAEALAKSDPDTNTELLALFETKRRQLIGDALKEGLDLDPDPALAFVDVPAQRVLFTPSARPEAWSQDGIPTPALPTEAGRQLGAFVLEEELGEGGFGEVWRARQERPVERQVALKILKQGLHSTRARTRFDLEQQALARLDHPNIARLYEAGTTPNGRPFFAMEWVDGTTLSHFVKDEGASLALRLELFTQICRAIEHAHQKGILHRDLKPSNVMITTNGGIAAKVIDFGIARALEEPLGDQTLLTRAFEVMGTPVYMSPEQCASATDTEARSDVYSLGVIFYELLCGQLPFDRKLPPGELQRAIREGDPPRPSQRVADGPEARQLRGDLDWITLKCLERDPERRYPTVEALRHDLERHAGDKPVEAGPPELGYRIRKFMRRNRVGVAVVTAVTLSVVGGLVFALLGFARARTEAGNAREAEQETVEALLTTAGALTDSRSATGLLNSDLGENAEAALWFAYAAKHAKDPSKADLNKRRFIEWSRVIPAPIAALKVEKPYSWDLKFSPGSELLRVMTFYGKLETPERRVQFLPVLEPEKFAGLANRVFRAADVHPIERRVALVDTEGGAFHLRLGDRTHYRDGGAVRRGARGGGFQQGRKSIGRGRDSEGRGWGICGGRAAQRSGGRHAGLASPGRLSLLSRVECGWPVSGGGSGSGGREYPGKESILR